MPAVPAVSPASTVPAFAVRAQRIVGILLLALTLTGCAGVRMETAAPLEPAPDMAEVMRRAAVHDALQVSAAAAELRDGQVDCAAGIGGGLGFCDALEFVVRNQIIYASDALGGVYDSGLGSSVSSGDDAEIESPEPPTTNQLISRLIEAGYRNRDAANFAQSGEFARLLASFSAAQFAAAVRLADLADQPIPHLPVGSQLLEFPYHFYTPTHTTPGEVPYDPGAAEDDEEVIDPTAGADVQGDFLPDNVLVTPVGLGVQDFSAIVASEDAARFAYEVTAARLADAERAQFRALAGRHFERANVWAHFGQLVGTIQDPRQVAYSVPEFASPPELVIFVETGLSERYAALIPLAAPGSRLTLIDELIESNLARERWGGAPLAFPGAPDIASRLNVEPTLSDTPGFPHVFGETG